MTDIIEARFAGPNGLAFSADERQLYIADSRERHIGRFDVSAGLLLASSSLPRPACASAGMTPGTPARGPAG